MTTTTTTSRVGFPPVLPRVRAGSRRHRTSRSTATATTPRPPTCSPPRPTPHRPTDASVAGEQRHQLPGQRVDLFGGRAVIGGVGSGGVGHVVVARHPEE